MHLTAVTVKEEGIWKFQQQQFQFDTDFSFSLLACMLLFAWLIADVITIIVFGANSYRKKL